MEFRPLSVEAKKGRADFSIRSISTQFLTEIPVVPPVLHSSLSHQIPRRSSWPSCCHRFWGWGGGGTSVSRRPSEAVFLIFSQPARSTRMRRPCVTDPPPPAASTSLAGPRGGGGEIFPFSQRRRKCGPNPSPQIIITSAYSGAGCLAFSQNTGRGGEVPGHIPRPCDDGSSDDRVKGLHQRSTVAKKELVAVLEQRKAGVDRPPRTSFRRRRRFKTSSMNTCGQ